MEYSIYTLLVSTNDSTPSASLNESALESENVSHLRNEPVFSEPIHNPSLLQGKGSDVETEDGEARFRTQALGATGPDRQRRRRNKCPKCGLANARRDHATNDAYCLMRRRRHKDLSMLPSLLSQLSIQENQTNPAEAPASQQTNNTTVDAMEVHDEAAIPNTTQQAPTNPTSTSAPVAVARAPATTIIPANIECIGLRLHFAVNRTPVGDYPLALHSLPNGLRWRSEIFGRTMFLTSFDCIGIVDTSQSGPQYCINCQAIRFDPAYQVVQSAMVGTLPPPSAPFEHYSFNGFKTKIEEMNKRIRQLEIVKACLEKELDGRKDGRQPPDMMHDADAS